MKLSQKNIIENSLLSYRVSDLLHENSANPTCMSNVAHQRTLAGQTLECRWSVTNELFLNLKSSSLVVGKTKTWSNPNRQTGGRSMTNVLYLCQHYFSFFLFNFLKQMEKPSIRWHTPSDPTQYYIEMQLDSIPWCNGKTTVFSDMLLIL